MKKIRNILLAVVVLPCLVSAGMGVADHDVQAEGKVYVCTGRGITARPGARGCTPAPRR